MKAIITRNDQTAVLELPTSRMELAGSLSQIGIRTPAHIIPCSDEEEDYIKVKLFGESDFENELTALVTPKDSLGSVNTALDLYRELPQTQKEKLKAELSQNPPDGLSSLCQKVMDFQPKYVTEDYYFPLTVTVYEYNDYGDLDYDSDCELDGRFADDYADEIKAMFDAYTASDDTDMAEYSPCEQSSIEFALERIGADRLEDCHVQLSCSRSGKPLSEVMERILNEEALEAFNEVCHATAKIPDRDLDKFTAAVLYANADTSCEVCRIAESMELFEYAPGVRDTNKLGAWWLGNKLDCSLPYEIDEFFDYDGYGESIVENNDGEFVEGLGFVCMEEGYTLEDVLQDTDQGMGGM